MVRELFEMAIPSLSEQLVCRLERNVTRNKVQSEILFLIVIHCNYCWGRRALCLYVCYDLHTEIDSRAKKTAKELVTTGSLSSPVPRRLGIIGIRDNVTHLGRACAAQICALVPPSVGGI